LPSISETVFVAQVKTVTVIFPVALTLPQPPVKGIVYVKLPVAVGVPLIVITLLDHEAVTPVGNPVAVPMPVAPVVDIVIGVKAVFTTREGDEDGLPAVLVMMHPHVGSPLEEIVKD
jgi:hypothetical protein